jgi:hypothetical protein
VSGSSNPKLDRLGEIIETSTSGYWVECDQVDRPPPLGAVVRVACRNGDDVFAVVATTMTAGIDETRRAVRRGSPEVQDEAIYQRHPELGVILRTVFEAVPIGYRRDGRFRALLPPTPPPLHYSVCGASDSEIERLTRDPRYLSLLVDRNDSLIGDQLVIAHVRQVDERFAVPDDGWRERAARALADHLRGDYRRLIRILEQIEPESESSSAAFRQ